MLLPPVPVNVGSEAILDPATFRSFSVGGASAVCVPMAFLRVSGANANTNVAKVRFYYTVEVVYQPQVNFPV